MNTTISLTNHILGKSVYSLYYPKEKTAFGFVKRKILTRILALSTSLFEFADTLLNLGGGVATLSLWSLKKAGIRILNREKYSLPMAKNYFDACRKSSKGIFIGTPRSVWDPRQLVTQDVKEHLFIIDHQKVAKKELKEMSHEKQNEDWHLLKYVGHAKLINLERDKKRLEEAREHFSKIGLSLQDVERFAAVIGNELPRETWDRFPNPPNYPLDTQEKIKVIDKWHAAQAGCYLSHYHAIKKAKENHELAKANYRSMQIQLIELKKSADNTNCKSKEQIHLLKKNLEDAQERIKKFSSVLIMEDDNRFGQLIDKKEKKATLEKVGVIFRQIMQELPQDFDMLFFSSITSKKEKWGDMKGIPGAKQTRKRLKQINNKRIAKLDYGYGANAYLVHSRFYDTILNKLSKIDIVNHPLKAVDVEIAELMENSNTYLAIPPIAYQGGYMSNLSSQDLPLIQPNKKLWKKIIIK